MPLLDGLELRLDIDGVVRGQGADPAILRARNPRLYKIAERALEEASHLFQPQVLYRHLQIEKMVHNRVVLEGGISLKRALLQHLGASREVILILCTIGPELEKFARQVMAQDSIYGLALDGTGSAAVEALANAACNYFENQASARNWQTTIPLSPGMIGWDVEIGQHQIFDLLDSAQIGVSLDRGGYMLPLKSLSLILGMGPDLTGKGSTCDYCSMKNICRYQNHYAPIHK